MNVFNLPAGVPFARTLARGLLQQHPQPEALADVTVFLPSRRGVVALRDALIEQSLVDQHRGALLLPRLCTFGDTLDDENPLLPVNDDDLRVPSPSARVLLLSDLLQRQCQSPAGGAFDPDEAIAYAVTLLELLDSLHAERVPPAALRNLDAGAYPEYRQHVLRMLETVVSARPALMLERGLTDPNLRRDQAAAALCRAWALHPPKTPVYAAGSTGSIPAGADLIAAVAALPQGTVLLPGLDVELSPSVRAVLEAPERSDHPQYGLLRLCARLQVDPATVPIWPPAEDTPHAAARRALWRAVMRPAAACPAPESEQALPEQIALARQGLHLIEADDELFEARVIAALLREAVETPARTAMLITPDRLLAMRVGGLLHGYGIAADDSAGRPLCDTPPGLFMRMLIDVVLSDFGGAALTTLWRHPLCAPALRRVGAVLERRVLRGPPTGPGLDGLAASARHRLPEDQAEAGAAAIETLRTLFAPLLRLSAIIDPAAAADALRQTIAAAGVRCFAGDDGEALAAFLDDLQTGAACDLPIEREAVLRHAARFSANVAVRGEAGLHPRIKIRGTPEARLESADLLILGGLNEGTWPRTFDPGIWLSHGMRAQLGLSTIERRIGLASHDLVQAGCAAEVVLTRARKSGGRPTLPSRRIRRLKMLLHETPLPEHAMVGIVRAQQAAAAPPPSTERRIWVPADLRPTRIRVTDVPLLADFPYAFYAKNVLRLRALDAVADDDWARFVGRLLHKVAEYAARFSDNPEAAVRAAQADCGIVDLPTLDARTQSMLLRCARVLCDAERESALALREHAADCEIVPGMRLAARADLLRDSVLIDFKTGTPDKHSPQLPLTAAVLHDSGAAALPEQLAYVQCNLKTGMVHTMVVAEGEAAVAQVVEAAKARLCDALMQMRASAFAYVAPNEDNALSIGDEYFDLAGLRPRRRG